MKKIKYQKISSNPCYLQVIIPMSGIFLIFLGVYADFPIKGFPAFIIIQEIILIFYAFRYFQFKNVKYENGNLLINDLFKTIIVPVENVSTASITDISKEFIVQLEFKTKTNFGTKIKFIGLSHLRIPYEPNKGIFLAPGLIIKKYPNVDSIKF